MKTEIRPGKAPFVDKSYFPDGFTNCSFFSQQQSSQLAEYGETLVGLECGIKFPQNTEERNFVAFCRGNKSATTELERLWENYRGQIRKMQHVA